MITRIKNYHETEKEELNEIIRWMTNENINK